MVDTAQEFGRFRALFWPIYRNEVKKILPMMLMLFFICFNYSVLRNVKDVVVITAQSSGAEVLPFIKVWVILPMAVLTTVIFAKLSNRFSQEKVFYIIISAFLLFYGLFVFVFYPLQHSLHPHAFADYLQSILPAGFKGMIAMCRNWTFTLFYTACELWSTLVLTVLFWGFANEVTGLKEARRFYGMLGVIGSSAGIIAGLVANWISDDASWELTLRYLVSAVIGSGILTMLIFRWMNAYVLNDPRFHNLHEPAHPDKIQPLKVKKRLSMRESFAFLSNSSYLICIAALVVSYHLVINLVEIVWKDQLQHLYPSPVDYSYYMNAMTSAVGVIATLISFGMSSLIGKVGWMRTAVITPLIMLLTSIGFFGFMLFREQLQDPVFLLTGTTPLAIAVFFGAAQVCLSKACKYSVFDTTKEMAFIPLDHESKLKGKAAIDGIGSRLGKSGGSFIHSTLLLFLATVSASAPYVAVILTGVIGAWICAVRSLGKKFAVLAGTQKKEDIDPSLLIAAPLDPQPQRTENLSYTPST